CDREAVRERDRDDVLAADDAGATADEDQRERADELCDAPTHQALVHGQNATSSVGRKARSGEPLRGVQTSRGGGRLAAERRGRMPALSQDVRRTAAPGRAGG